MRVFKKVHPQYSLFAIASFLVLNIIIYVLIYNIYDCPLNSLWNIAKDILTLNLATLALVRSDLRKQSISIYCADEIEKSDSAGQLLKLTGSYDKDIINPRLIIFSTNTRKLQSTDPKHHIKIKGNESTILKSELISAKKDNQDNHDRLPNGTPLLVHIKPSYPCQYSFIATGEIKMYIEYLFADKQRKKTFTIQFEGIFGGN
jgi:hypothetical protein